MNDDSHFLEIIHLEKRYAGHTVLDQLNLSIAKGEICALLGASGCGKSTLLRLIAGFETLDGGDILLKNQSLVALAPHKRPINMMFQSYALFPHLSVFNNVAFGLRRKKVVKHEIQRRVEEALSLVRLQDLSHRKPHQLSGGQQQRVALARSIVTEPLLLLLDEPLGALDKKLREDTQYELKNILQQLKITCLFVTHDQEEAMTLAHRMVVMQAGKFVQVGSPKEIYESPKNKFVAEFMGNINIFPILSETVDPQKYTTSLGDIYVRTKVRGVKYLGLRPDKMVLLKTHEMDAQTAVIPALIERSIYLGNKEILFLKSLMGGGQFKVHLPISKAVYSSGEVVRVGWHEEDLLLLPDA